MANNYENFGFNQNALFMSNFLGFYEGSGDLSITPCPTIPQNNESLNDFFMSNSLENHVFPAGYGDLDQNEPFMWGSHGTLRGFEDLAITYPTIQQNNVGGNDTQISHPRFDGITFTCPPSGQNSAPFVPSSLGIWGGINHSGSSYDSSNNQGNNANTSRTFSRSTNMVNRSPSSRQCNKRVRFRFVLWSNEEKQLMDRELLKYTFLPFFNICVKIAGLLPKKSIRDIAMRIQWLIRGDMCSSQYSSLHTKDFNQFTSRLCIAHCAVKCYFNQLSTCSINSWKEGNKMHDKLDNIWDWVEPSLGEDLSDLSFYIPDNPNDPDLLAIQNRFGPLAIKRSRV